MGFIDLVLGGLILLGFIRGYINGFLMEVTTLVALALGIYGAIKFSYFAGGLIKQYVDWEQPYIDIVAFALTFIVILILVSWLGKLLTQVAQFAAIGFINKFLGALFGGIKYTLILAIALVFLNLGNRDHALIKKETLESSFFYEKLVDLGYWVFGWALPIEDKDIDTSLPEPI